jgi:hypothetical protein
MLINRRQLVNSLRINYAFKKGGCHGTCFAKPFSYAYLALKIDPFQISNPISIRIRVFKGFSFLLLSSLFIFKLSFITSL